MKTRNKNKSTSGGHFEYNQYNIGYIADVIQDEIADNDVRPEGWNEESDGDWKGPRHSEKVIEKMKEAARALRVAEIYTHRLDRYLSGNAGEESFIESLEKDLKKINDGTQG